MKATTKAELMKAKNMKEFLDIVSKNYNLDKAEIGFIARPIIMKHIETFLTLVNAKEKI